MIPIIQRGAFYPMHEMGLGFMDNVAISSSALPELKLNHATYPKWAHNFMLPIAKTLKYVHVFSYKKYGSLSAPDWECLHRQDDGTVTPGTQIGATKALSSAPTEYQWFTFDFNTGDSTHLCAANTLYWIEFNNANAVPGTNHMSFVGASAGVAHNLAAFGYKSSIGQLTIGRRSTVTTLYDTLVAGGVSPIVLEFTDGSVWGSVSALNESFAGLNIYGAGNKAGVRFTTPPHIHLASTGVHNHPISGVSPPSGEYLYHDLYYGTTKLATTIGIVKERLMGANFYAYTWIFDKPVILKPSTDYRLVQSFPNGTSGGYYRQICMRTYDAETVIGTDKARSLRPFWGSACLTYTSDGGATWTDDETRVPYMGMQVDSYFGFQGMKPHRMRWRG